MPRRSTWLLMVTLLALVAMLVIAAWLDARNRRLLNQLDAVTPRVDPPQLQDGDLILFCGDADHRVHTWLITTFTASPVSHVGVVCVLGGVPHLWDVPCVGSPSRLTPMCDVVRHYRGHVYARRLRSTGGGVPQSLLRARLTRFIDAHLDMRYSLVYREGAGWHCAALAAATYTDLGVLRKDRRYDVYLPRHFWCDTEKLSLNDGWYFDRTPLKLACTTAAEVR